MSVVKILCVKCDAEVANQEGFYKNFTGEIDWGKTRGTVKNATFELKPNYIEWQDGTWVNGYWDGGTWHNGTWHNGTWRLGHWLGGTWKNGTWKNGEWYNGTWEDGTWKGGDWRDGTWYNGAWERGGWKHGTWYNGTWKYGVWFGGTWQDGTWYNGDWEGGIWKNGTWKDGTWENGTWKDGTWIGGYWKKGIWERGIYRGTNLENVKGGMSFEKPLISSFKEACLSSGIKTKASELNYYKNFTELSSIAPGPRGGSRSNLKQWPFIDLTLILPDKVEGKAYLNDISGLTGYQPDKVGGYNIKFPTLAKQVTGETIEKVISSYVKKVLDIWKKAK